MPESRRGLLRRPPRRRGRSGIGGGREARKAAEPELLPRGSRAGGGQIPSLACGEENEVTSKQQLQQPAPAGAAGGRGKMELGDDNDDKGAGGRFLLSPRALAAPPRRAPPPGGRRRLTITLRRRALCVLWCILSGRRKSDPLPHRPCAQRNFPGKQQDSSTLRPLQLLCSSAEQQREATHQLHTSARSGRVFVLAGETEKVLTR